MTTIVGKVPYLEIVVVDAVIMASEVVERPSR